MKNTKSASLAILLVICVAAIFWKLYSLDRRIKTLESSATPVELHGHAYVVVPHVMRWVQARAYAEKLGGYLAVISSTEENRFVADLATSRDVYEAIWIGLTDEEQEGTWKWVDGEAFVYSNWEKGEPNGGRGENYVNIGHNSPYTWNDASNWARYPFVVEFTSAKDIK